MPQVVTEQVTQVISNGGTDLFSYPNTQQQSILDLQVPSTQPLPAGTDTATNLLNPDLQIAQQLSNFPPNLYDLASTSVLTHFMTALLGDAGAGQLRKRQLVSRLQQAVTSTNFYDLDSFYGALFGAQRGPSGSLPTNPATGLPVDPYSDLASGDGWDEIAAIDAQFRERIIALAKAITLGGTMPGIQALAEAITGVTCEVYETWHFLTNAQTPTPGANTWAQIMTTEPSWTAIDGTTWQTLDGGAPSFSGLLGQGLANEIVIVPKKKYLSDVTDQAQEAADQYGILSVAEVLRPAQSLISVNVNGPQVVRQVPISAAWADSEYWEPLHLVTPASQSDPAYAKIMGSYQGSGQAGSTIGTPIPVPSPPLSKSQGSQYSYSGDVTTTVAQATTGADPNTAVVTTGIDYQTVNYPAGSRSRATLAESYLPSQAIMAPAQAATARTASPVGVTCAPYSGPRVPVQVHS
jgi:hypothetical protein